jgi:hypothetical protein
LCTKIPVFDPFTPKNSPFSRFCNVFSKLIHYTRVVIRLCLSATYTAIARRSSGSSFTSYDVRPRAAPAAPGSLNGAVPQAPHDTQGQAPRLTRFQKKKSSFFKKDLLSREKRRNFVFSSRHDNGGKIQNSALKHEQFFENRKHGSTQRTVYFH